MALVQIGLAIGGAAAESSDLDDAQVTARARARQRRIDARNTRIRDRRNVDRELSLGRRQLSVASKRQKEEEKLIEEQIKDAETEAAQTGFIDAARRLDEPKKSTSVFGGSSLGRRA